MHQKHFIDIDCQQKNHHGERICGDVYLTGKIKEENRIIIVLSDGMGHGVKANVLATLTATMGLKFTEEHKAPKKTAEIIMNTLPECSDRRISYSTFTIIEIDQMGEVKIVEYDNPTSIVLRMGITYDPKWTTISLEGDANKDKKIRVCNFTPQKGDRIIFCSDGITQAGLGSENFPFGWSEDNLERFVLDNVKRNKDISSRMLATKVLNMAYRLDNFKAKDDTSCGVIHFRDPRRLLICTGPPYHKEDDIKLAEKVKHFDGKKIVMGATTGDIISRELGLEITDKFDFFDADLPPVAHMEGVDLVTEGVLTLNKIEKILQNYSTSYQPGQGPADQILKMIRESDEIHFLIGTRVNVAHQDPTLPIELEIRRTIVRRVITLVEEKLLKEVRASFL
jgi:serine/threonine protein phosphatase PrpC